jgi:hypothetical protein
MIINVSEWKPNYSQRNNLVRPLSSCNTTSMVMATSYMDKLWSIYLQSPYYAKYKQFEQPEDKLQQAMLDWGLDPTVHADLMAGYNKFMGRPIDRFSTLCKFSDLAADLISGKPWVGSGTFLGHPVLGAKPLGHIVCVVGLVYEVDPLFPQEVIIDDPYGDTLHNWKGSGNDVHIPWDLFVAWMKPVGNPDIFWAHRFFYES